MKDIFSQVRHPSYPGRGHGSLTWHMTKFERSDWLRSENFINIMIEYMAKPNIKQINIPHHTGQVFYYLFYAFWNWFLKENNCVYKWEWLVWCKKFISWWKKILSWHWSNGMKVWTFLCKWYFNQFYHRCFLYGCNCQPMHLKKNQYIYILQLSMVSSLWVHLHPIVQPWAYPSLLLYKTPRRSGVIPV